jgi:hypothetical protein
MAIFSSKQMEVSPVASVRTPQLSISRVTSISGLDSPNAADESLRK